MKKKLKLEVMISCMNQVDCSLVERSGITSDVIMINQCDEKGSYTEYRPHQVIRKIDVVDRGLSKSRNLALDHVKGDIGLLCDDDESFIPDYESMIITAFQELPDADVIAFKIANQKSRLKNHIQRLNFFTCLRIASWQIAFKTQPIRAKKIYFDEFMGAGTGNGGGEENKFLHDCLKAGLKLYYVPCEIAVVAQNQSTWFYGFNREFFYQRGAATRYMLGAPLAFFYAIYYVVMKQQIYRNTISPAEAFISTMHGILKNDIRQQKLRSDKGE